MVGENLPVPAMEFVTAGFRDDVDVGASLGDLSRSAKLTDVHFQGIRQLSWPSATSVLLHSIGLDNIRAQSHVLDTLVEGGLANRCRIWHRGDHHAGGHQSNVTVPATVLSRGEDFV